MTSRYGRPLELGISLVPNRADLDRMRDLARRADELGLDLVGIQDHPYQWRYLDTFSLIGDLLARTERIRFFPDVANLPLRLPALIAKQATSLDVLSGGRFELGLGITRYAAYTPASRHRTRSASGSASASRADSRSPASSPMVECRPSGGQRPCSSRR